MSDLRTNHSRQSATLWDKVLNFLKIGNSNSASVRAIDGQKSMPESWPEPWSVEPQTSAELSARTIKPADEPAPHSYQQAIGVIGLHAAIRNADNRQKLNVLENRIQQDSSLDADNRSTLIEAINRKRENLPNL